jgi:hypothetical protein
MLLRKLFVQLFLLILQLRYFNYFLKAVFCQKEFSLDQRLILLHWTKDSF